MKRTGTTNPMLQELIVEMKKKSISDNTRVWKRIAHDLERPTRNRRIVNIARINRFTKPDETIIVPGKVLGSGSLDHKLTIAAFSFSRGALKEIEQGNAKAVLLKDFLKEDIKGKRVRIIG
jgi:large subunit ribosomal protein L18e